MQPKRLAFTDEESNQLGEYLDKFVQTGCPIESLSQDQFRDIQSLVAQKIWEIRPDIARAIQAVADKDQLPALIIENTPVDKDLPATPMYVERVIGMKSTPMRSHFFNAGVGLIRYGNIVPLTSLTMIDVVNEPESIREGKVTGRGMHRDIYRRNLGDITLHVQRENPKAQTPLVSIGDMPPELVERLRNTQYNCVGAVGPVIQETTEGLRFHPFFKAKDDMYNSSDKQAVEDFFTWMRDTASKDNPVALHDREFLLIDQSRVFHGASAHEVITPRSEDRWLVHARAEVLDGSHYGNDDKAQPFYLFPPHVDETSLLAGMQAAAPAKGGWHDTPRPGRSVI